MMLKMIMMMTMRLRITIMTIVMTLRSMMMLSDAPGSSGVGTQRAKDGGGEGWRPPEHQEHEEYKYLLFIIYHL